MHQRYQDQGLEVVAINVGQGAADVAPYVATNQLSFAHLLDLDQKVSGRFFVFATPANFVVDRQGRIVAGIMGFRDWDAPAAQRLFESLLAERTAPR